MKSLHAFLLGVILLYCWSCKEKVTGPETTTPIVFAGFSTICLSHGIQKISSVDSLVYTFTDSLVIDDAETTSCSKGYPFAPRYSVHLDTLTLTVADTLLASANCICAYNVHFSFSNLPDNNYYVIRIRSWIEPDPTAPSYPYKFVTYYDTTYLGDVSRKR